jgi:hypothetical protein
VSHQHFLFVGYHLFNGLQSVLCSHGMPLLRLIT